MFVRKPEFPLEQVVCRINETKFINCQSEDVTSLFIMSAQATLSWFEKMSQEWTYLIRSTYI